MGVKANGDAGSGGIFKKAIRNLSMRGSMSKAKHAKIERLGKETVERQKAMTMMGDAINSKKYNPKLSSAISETEFADEATRQLRFDAQKLEYSQHMDRIEKLENNKGLKGAKFGDKLAIGAKGIANYYSPFNDDSVGAKTLRYGATALGVGGAAVGIRYAQGGDMTRDQYGNKDIAGIPFI